MRIINAAGAGSTWAASGPAPSITHIIYSNILYTYYYIIYAYDNIIYVLYNICV